MVAVFIENYDKYPVIGKVLAADEAADDFEIHYWKGTYKGKWKPQHVPRKLDVPWTDKLPKSCILCYNFAFTDESKLLPSTRKFLENKYKEVLEQSSR